MTRSTLTFTFTRILLVYLPGGMCIILAEDLSIETDEDTAAFFKIGRIVPTAFDTDHARRFNSWLEFTTWLQEVGAVVTEASTVEIHH